MQILRIVAAMTMAKVFSDEGFGDSKWTRSE